MVFSWMNISKPYYAPNLPKKFNYPNNITIIYTKLPTLDSILFHINLIPIQYTWSLSPTTLPIENHNPIVVFGSIIISQ